MSTTMQQAFEKVRYIDPREAAFQRVMDVADEVWRKWSSVEGVGARRDHIKSAFKLDPVWVWLERCQPQALALAITWALTEAEKRIEDQRPRGPERSGGGAGHRPDGNQTTDARSTDNTRDASRGADREGQTRYDSQAPNALPVDPSRDAPEGAAGGGQTAFGAQARRAPAGLPDHAPAQAGRGSEAANAATATTSATPPAPPLDRAALRLAGKIAVELRLCRLDTVLIDGKPIGDCTVGEVKAWAERRKGDAREASRDVRFALSLVDNLENHKLIRKWVRPEEADARYTKAEAEHAA